MVHIVNQVADALDHAHSQGLIHARHQASNIIVTRFARPRVLMDFGCVRAGQDSKLTKTGMIVGSARVHVAGAAQGEEVDYRTDLYSLGVVLYRCSQGRRRSSVRPRRVLLAHVATSRPPRFPV